MALILIPLAAASVPYSDLDTFQGEAIRLELEDGSTTAGFKALVAHDFDRQQTASPQFVLRGGQITLETDYVLSTAGPITMAPEPSTNAEELDDYVIEGLENREDYWLSIVNPEGPVTFSSTSSCNHSWPAGRTQVESDIYVDPKRNAPEVDTFRSFQWSQCNDSKKELFIEGSFVLSLWEWDVTIESPDGEQDIRTSGESPPEGEASSLHPYAVERRQIWLFVEDGEMEIPYWKDALIFLDDLSAEAGNATLEDPSGGMRLGGEFIPIDGERMELSGNFTFNVQGYEDSLSTSAIGGFTNVEVDGKPMGQTPIPAREESSLFTVLGLIALIAATVLVLTGTVVWHTSPKLRSAVLIPLQRRRDVLFEQALTEGTIYNMDRLKKRRKWVKLSLRLRPNHPEALAAMGTIYFHLKKYEKALDRFQQAIANMDSEHCPNEVPEDAVAFWAVECARCLGWMRLKRPREQWDDLSEKIMAHTHMAAKVDPEVASMLLNYPFLSDLTNAIVMAIDTGEYSVKP